MVESDLDLVRAYGPNTQYFDSADTKGFVVGNTFRKGTVIRKGFVVGGRQRGIRVCYARGKDFCNACIEGGHSAKLECKIPLIN